MALLEIRNITRRFGAFEAVKDVSFAVEAGKFFILLGPSGCGQALPAALNERADRLEKLEDGLEVMLRQQQDRNRWLAAIALLLAALVAINLAVF